jgi:hypothetical protein
MDGLGPVLIIQAMGGDGGGGGGLKRRMRWRWWYGGIYTLHICTSATISNGSVHGAGRIVFKHVKMKAGEKSGNDGVRDRPLSSEPDCVCISRLTIN